MKKLFLLLCLLLSKNVFGQTSELPLVLQVLEAYDRYREPAIKTRLFKHKDVLELIRKHEGNGLLKNEIIGSSVQGRSIHHLTMGKGDIKILMWSQMHGDEATATMALFDPNFLFLPFGPGTQNLENP